MPSQSLLVSPGRTRPTWTNRTRRPWRSAGITRDPGPCSPRTHGRCCSVHIFFPFVSVPCLSVHLPFQGPPGAKGEKGDHGLPGLQVMWQGHGRVRPQAGPSFAYDIGSASWTISVPSQGLSGQQGIPGKTGLQGPKVLVPGPVGGEWERVGPGRVLETEASFST